MGTDDEAFSTPKALYVTIPPREAEHAYHEAYVFVGPEAQEN